MPGRKYSAGTQYRYGFNGKEEDDEVKGDGNQQDYGMRIYDPRLGKFLSVDPLASKYPWYTPYQFAGNMPILAIDLDGLEIGIPMPVGMSDYGMKINSKKAVEVFKGTLKAAAMGVGVVTEIFFATHKGDKIKNKEQAFPLTHDNIAYTAKGMITAPVDLAMRLRKDPSNGELWGEAFAFIGALRINIGIKGSAPDIALGLNEPVPAGPPRSLVRFAKEQSAYMHYDWNKGVFGSIASGDGFGQIVTAVIDHVVNNNGKIKFDLTKLDMDRAVLDYGKPHIAAEAMTGFELNSIMNNKKYLDATEFYRDGKLQNKKDIIAEYNKALEKSKQNQ